MELAKAAYTWSEPDDPAVRQRSVEERLKYACNFFTHILLVYYHSPSGSTSLQGRQRYPFRIVLTGAINGYIVEGYACPID